MILLIIEFVNRITTNNNWYLVEMNSVEYSLNIKEQR